MQKSSKSIQQKFSHLPCQLGSFSKDGHHCYGLNVHLPKICMLESQLLCHGVRRCGLQKGIGSLGWSPHEWISALIRQTPESSRPPSLLWGRKEKTSAVNHEEGILQKVAMLVLWPWTSQSPELWKINLFFYFLTFYTYFNVKQFFKLRINMHSLWKDQNVIQADVTNVNTLED